MVAALVCIPLLISSLGTARFGILTLIWAVSSYFGLFDFGLGRVLTQQVAAALELGEDARIGAIVGTAMLAMAIASLLGSTLMASGANSIGSWIRGQPDEGETGRAVMAMAVALPAVIFTSGLRGILEARGAFGVVNAIRVPMGLFTFAGPLAVVLWAAPRLDWIAWALCSGRWVGMVAHLLAVYLVTPKEQRQPAFDLRLLRPLATSGGWMSLSNVVSPFMGYVDRFLLGAMVSVTAVAHYATPLELVIKLSIVPAALTGVLFPAFSAALAHNLPRESQPLFERSVLGLYLTLLPICCGLALFASELLNLWIGAEFAGNSTPLLQVFAVGILINCLAHVPFTLIQSAGQARTTALIHLIELPFFLAVMALLITHHGALGAAFAWALRMVVDALLMFIAASKVLTFKWTKWLTGRNLSLAAIGIAGFMGVLLDDSLLKALWLLGICAASAMLARQRLAKTAPTA